jgi:hypothetical protein
MKKILLIILLSAALFSCSNEKETLESPQGLTFSGKVTLDAAAEKQLIEARVYSYYNPDSLLAYTKADASGSFSIDIPNAGE